MGLAQRFQLGHIGGLERVRHVRAGSCDQRQRALNRLALGFEVLAQFSEPVRHYGHVGQRFLHETATGRTGIGQPYCGRRCRQRRHEARFDRTGNQATNHGGGLIVGRGIQRRHRAIGQIGDAELAALERAIHAVGVDQEHVVLIGSGHRPLQLDRRGDPVLAEFALNHPVRDL